MPDESMPLKLHKSHLTAFNLCPRYFEFLYLKGGIHTIKTWPFAQVGEQFHEFAKNFFTWIEREELERLQTREEVRSYFSAFVKTDVPLLRQNCLNFCEFETEHYFAVKQYGFRYFLPLHMELEVATEQFEGTIDRVDLLSDNTSLILEYKTEAYWSLPKLKQELTFYALLYNYTAKKHPSTHIGCYNSHLNLFWVDKISLRTAEKVERQILQVLDCIKEESFEKKITGFCRFCPLSRECLYGGSLDKG